MNILFLRNCYISKSSSIPPSVSSFLLTSKQDANLIIAQQRRCGTITVQIVDHFPIDDYKMVLDELPGISLVQVIHVRDEESVEEAITQVRPFGVDLCSGVRTNGKLDEEKLARFFNQVDSVSQK